MSALAEALLAAQRATLAAMQRAYLAGALEQEHIPTLMDEIGCTDKIEQGHYLAALIALRGFGVQSPATNGKPSPENEPASERQMAYIAKLADERGTIAPDWPLTKEQASKVIEQLKAGTYNADEYTAPF